jgi:hypothetical protein
MSEPDKMIYRKVGRRYKPLGVYETLNVFPIGATLVVVEESDHCRSTVCIRVKSIDPDFVRLEAAAVTLSNKLVKIIGDETAARPSRELTPRQALAWEAYKKAGGADTLLVPSLCAAADSILSAIKEAARGQIK